MATDEHHDPPVPGPASTLTPLEEALHPRRTARWVAAGIAVVLVAGLALLLATRGGSGDDGAAQGLPDEGVAVIDETTASPSDDSTSADADASSASTAGAPSREDAMLEYAECMRDHGVDMPDPQPVGGDSGGAVLSPGGPGGAPGGPGGEEFAAAQEACQPILDAAGLTREPPSAEQLAEQQDQMLQVAQCMRDRGHDFEDPEPGSVGGRGFAEGSNADDETFRADLDECSRAAGLRGAADGADGGDG
jgi:hypothetical protein